MIPWMREKFNEKRAKWLARNKRNADQNPNNVSTVAATTTTAATTSSGSGSEADTSSLGSNLSNPLPVRTTEMETQTEIIGSCVFRTPPPARRRLAQLELQMQAQAAAAAAAAAVATTKLHTKQASVKTSVRLSTDSTTCAEVDGTSKSAEFIVVRVICPSSRVLVFKAELTKRLLDLKTEVILELSDDPDSIQLFAADVRHLSPRYRLFRAEYYGSELNENQTLQQLNVRNNDTFILAQRRSALSQAISRIREVPGPTDVNIESCTRTMVSNSSSVPTIDINEIFQQSNIQYDVRKVLISLAQASAAIIGTGPYAPRLISMLKQRLINRRNQQADTLQCLVDMGFKRELAELSLRANNGVYSTTLEWLIQNQNEDNEYQLPMMQDSVSSISPSTIVTNDEAIDNTAALMQIVRIYSHRDSPPSEEIVESLVEMGFEESAVVAALKKTGNNKASACEWLCDNRSGSVIELREGLAPDSPILKVILEMPQVQMTLSNPKTFLAFLSILENEHAIRVWRGDNDTTSVITHILQKYHEEKHVLGINQFYINRW